MKALRSSCVFGSLLPLVLAGCEPGGRPNVYPVHGTVFVAGMPAASANVFFYPRDPSQQRVPVGITNREGTFQLTTMRSGDGAPEGDYDVTVLWPDYSIPRDECADPLHDRLKLQYADRNKTELHATIRKEKNEVVLQLHIEGSWSFPRQRDVPQ